MKEPELNSAPKCHHDGKMHVANTNARFPIEEIERMSKRRFQRGSLAKDNLWWYLRTWENTPGANRKRLRIKLAPADTPKRIIQQMAAERLDALNQRLITSGSGVNFSVYVDEIYQPTVLPLLAKGVQDTYRTMIRKHCFPVFGNQTLHDVTELSVQRFFSAMPSRGIAYPTMLKVKDALSSVLRSAVRLKFIPANPLEQVQLPPDKRGEIDKPILTPAQFQSLLDLLPEPYSSMLYVSAWTGLRVSELCALKWDCIHDDTISIKQRYSKGDWSKTKTKGSAATIAVEPHVIARIQRLKTLTVEVRAGRAVRLHKVVKGDAADNLVFQSVWQGKPMNAANVLKRHFQPAAEKLGIYVNWRCLRTSCATWMVAAGADPKSVQGQMRHSRIQTTLDIYAQFVPDGQKRAAAKLTEYVAGQAGPKSGPLLVQ